MYKIELGSSIHGEHIAAFHQTSYDGLWNFWRNTSNTIESWDAVFEYDPYYGTLPPETENIMREQQQGQETKTE